MLRLHENVVGRIRRGPSPAQVRLSIDPAYDATGITLSESFASVPGTSPKVGVVSRFLGGYVPEGYHRTVMASRRGVDPSELFGLLREYGGSLAGAVTVTPDSGARGADGSGWLEQLSSADLAERLRQAVRETDQAVPSDSRSTLPGFQPKLLAFRMAFAVRGSFDHRQVTRDSIVDEVTAWPSMTPTRAAAQVDAAMTVCGEAVAEVPPPDGLSEGLVDKVHTTVERLSAGDPIGVSPWQKGSRRQGA